LETYKKYKRLDFLPGAQIIITLLHYIILWLNLGLKPQERITNKRLDLGQASVEA